MSFTTAITRLSYNGDGVSVNFPVPWLFYANTDLLVIVGGATQSLSVQFNVTGAGIGSGTITFTSAPPIGVGNVQIILNDPLTQTANFVDGTAFPAATLNQVNDRAVQISSRLYDLITRSMRAPDGDASPSMVLPPAAARANGAPVFDANGNLTIGVLLSTPFTQALFNAYIGSSPGYSATPAENAAGVVPVNTFYLPGYIRRYGAVLDGVTDDTAAMVLAGRVGGRIIIDGPMAMASASLAALNAGAGITLKSGTTIYGVVGSPITITGSTACNVFRSVDCSDIEFIDCYFVGNGGPVASTFGFLWYIMCTAGATKNATNLKFIRGGAENFGGLYWIYLDNTAFVTFTAEKFLCDGSHFTSKPGNCQTAGLTTTTTTAAMFGFSGSDTNASVYSVKDCVVRNCVAAGTFIKEFLFFWSGCLRCKAHDNTLSGFGSDGTISDDTACYALAAYDHSHGTGLQPHLIEFYNNIINVVRDCGIYHASANSIRIYDNDISGQTSSANGSIPKGGIAGNGSTLLTMADNTLTNCKIGVSALQDPQTSDIYRINNTTILQVPASGIGVLISGTTGGNANDIGINGLSVDNSNSNVTGIKVNGTSAVGINNLDIQNVDIHACANGIILNSVDATVVALGNVRLCNIKLRHCTINTLTWASASNAGTRTLIENVDFLDMVAGASGLVVTNSTGLTIRGVTFQDLTSGATFCWGAGGAQGRVSGVQFMNVAVANRYDGAANRMGVDVPTWTGNDNDSLQDLNTNELGSAASKYTRMSWVWDRVAAAWKEQRALTGN